MRKIYAFLIPMLVLASCTDPFDATSIWEKLNELENKIDGSAGIPNEMSNNKIHYTTVDGEKMFPSNTAPSVFGAIIISNIYENGAGVLIFDDDITSIGGFNGCTQLASITIPNSVKNIGDYAFEGCSSLTSIEIPKNVTSIGGAAFRNCSNLTNITIPNSVKNIGNYAFEGCTGLGKVHINDLDDWCNIDFGNYFANPLCNSHNLYLNGELVTELVVPNGVAEIKGYTFSGCSSLENITIPNSVTGIGDSAFCGCNGLTSITFGNSVTSVGYDAFDGCSNLKEVHMTDVAAWCDIDFEYTVLMNAFGEIYYYTKANPLLYAKNLYLDGKLITDLLIPDGVTRINDCAFYGCSTFSSITIPNSVTIIGSYAFYNCSGLKEVHITDLNAWKNISFGDYSANPLKNDAKLYLNGVEITDY